MDLNLIKYKKAFGIKTPLNVFPPKELKRRWRILCQKYHPDKGGSKRAFQFVQEAYQALKKEQDLLAELGKLKEESKKATDDMFTSEVPHGIREIKVKFSDGYGYLWDIGESNFRKRQEWAKAHGTNINVKG